MPTKDKEVEDELTEETEERPGTWPDDELGIFDDDDPTQRRRDPLRRSGPFPPVEPKP